MSIVPKTEKADERTWVERLADVADAAFARANKLDGIKLLKRNDEASATIAETRDEAYLTCIDVWRLIIDMLPTSGLDHARRHNLEIDAFKVKSRCFHRLGNLEGARQAITKAIDLGYADGFISLGAICLDLGEHEEAEKAFRTALAKDVQVMRARAGLGELYFALGTQALKSSNPKHVEYFEMAEVEFLAAGRERFTEVYERAMELFETIGWKDKARSFGEKAVHYYTDNRLRYGDRLRSLDGKLRSLTGDERYERVLAGLGRGLGVLMGGKVRNGDGK